MSYVDAINQGATAQVQATKKEEDTTRDIMGKEDFLTLLVAQLKNQDPLNPDEPTEFTAQLAQFSSLEQLFNLNDSMKNVAASVSDSQKLSALSLIGKEVTYADGNFDFDGSPMQIGYSIDDAVKDITIYLKKDGATIATLEGTELTKGDHFLTWDGLTDEGVVAPTGQYTIVIEATAAAESVAAAPLIRSEVTGIDLDASNGGLLYTKAGETNVNDIKGVYEIGGQVSQEEQTEEQSGDLTDAVTDTVTDVAEDTESAEG